MDLPGIKLDGGGGARWGIVLAHGAGQGMDSPFMASLAAGIVASGDRAGGIRVARFDFPYMRRARAEGRRRAPDREAVLLDAWRDVLGALASAGWDRARTVIGGKSLGGRMASLLADEVGAAGLVCLGYPFHPPGKPERLRTAHLEHLRTPTLVCQGERDPFGSAAEVPGYRLSPAITVRWMPDGDHGFKPRAASGRSEAQNWALAATAVADFVASLA